MKTRRRNYQPLKIGALALLSLGGLDYFETKLFGQIKYPNDLPLFGLNLLVVFFLLIKPLFEQKAKIVPLRRKYGP